MRWIPDRWFYGDPWVIDPPEDYVPPPRKPDWQEISSDLVMAVMFVWGVFLMINGMLQEWLR